MVAVAEDHASHTRLSGIDGLEDQGLLANDFGDACGPVAEVES